MNSFWRHCRQRIGFQTIQELLISTILHITLVTWLMQRFSNVWIFSTEMLSTAIKVRSFLQGHVALESHGLYTVPLRGGYVPAFPVIYLLPDLPDYVTSLFPACTVGLLPAPGPSYLPSPVILYNKHLLRPVLKPALSPIVFITLPYTHNCKGMNKNMYI